MVWQWLGHNVLGYIVTLNSRTLIAIAASSVAY